MGWVDVKSVGFGCSYFGDVFEGREALEGFEPPPVVVGIDEVVEVGRQLGMAIIMVPFDGGHLDGAQSRQGSAFSTFQTEDCQLLHMRRLGKDSLTIHLAFGMKQLKGYISEFD